jgi:hypothetical protein
MHYVLEVTADFPTRVDTDIAHCEDLLLERLRALHHVSAVVVADATVVCEAADDHTARDAAATQEEEEETTHGPGFRDPAG